MRLLIAVICATVAFTAAVLCCSRVKPFASDFAATLFERSFPRPVFETTATIPVSAFSIGLP